MYRAGCSKVLKHDCNNALYLRLVLNTLPHTRPISAPESMRFFYVHSFLWPGSAKAEQQPVMAKAKGRLVAVLKYLAAPSTGAKFN